MAFAPITPPGWVISGPGWDFLVHLFLLSPAAEASEQEIFLRRFLSKLGANKTGRANKRVLLRRQNLIFLWLLFAAGWWFPICVVIWEAFLIIGLPDTLYIYEIVLMVKARDWWPLVWEQSTHGAFVTATMLHTWKTKNLLKEINYGLFVTRRSDKKETVRLNCNDDVVIYSGA